MFTGDAGIGGEALTHCATMLVLPEQSGGCWPLFTWPEVLEQVRCLEELSRFWGLCVGIPTALPSNSSPVHGIKWSCGNGTEEFSVEQLVQQILDTHPTKPAPRTHACLCSGGLGE